MAKLRGDKDLSCETLARFDLRSEYLDFLSNHRGLAQNTVNMRRHDVTAFRGGPQKSDSRIRCKIRQTIRRPQSNEQSETEAVHS